MVVFNPSMLGGEEVILQFLGMTKTILEVEVI